VRNVVTQSFRIARLERGGWGKCYERATLRGSRQAVVGGPGAGGCAGWFDDVMMVVVGVVMGVGLRRSVGPLLLSLF
jgi:hypothetical protein